MDRNVRDIMTTSVVTVSPEATLDAMRKLFAHEGFHHLVVVESGCVLGVLSDRDLLRHLSPWAGTMGETKSDRATLRKKAHQVMTRELVTATPDEPVIEAIKRLLLASVSCLPVVDADGNCIGIVTWRDLLRISAEHLESTPRLDPRTTPKNPGDGTEEAREAA